MANSPWPPPDAETRAAWAADAHLRGGVPLPTDPDPHVRFLANRIVHLLDALTVAERERDEWHEICARQNTALATAEIVAGMSAPPGGSAS